MPQASVALLGLYLLIPITTSAAPNIPADPQPADAACIHCHIKVYKQGMTAAFAHPPFHENRCRTCHTKPDDQYPIERGSAERQTAITGTVVMQEGLWGKRLIFPGSPDATVSHRVTLRGLAADQPYRFRLHLIREKDDGLDGAEVQSLWFGLKPREMVTAYPAGLTMGTVTDNAVNDQVETLTMNAPNPAAIELTWQTIMPLVATVEVQEMAGPELADDTSSASATVNTPPQPSHPQLRSPEELAIDTCYQCHPQSTLGTSHPVRLYSSGNQTRIPAELPTVEGMLTCVTCHDAHGAPGKGLVRHAVKTKLCVACHSKFKNRSLSTMFD